MKEVCGQFNDAWHTYDARYSLPPELRIWDLVRAMCEACTGDSIPSPLAIEKSHRLVYVLNLQDDGIIQREEVLTAGTHEIQSFTELQRVTSYSHSIIFNRNRNTSSYLTQSVVATDIDYREFTKLLDSFTGRKLSPISIDTIEYHYRAMSIRMCSASNRTSGSQYTVNYGSITSIYHGIMKRRGKCVKALSLGKNISPDIPTYTALHNKTIGY